MPTDEGSRSAICISFSACTTASTPQDTLDRGLSFGMGRLNRIMVPVQHTVRSSDRVYFLFGQLPSKWKEAQCLIQNLSAAFLTCAGLSWRRSKSSGKQPTLINSLPRTPFQKSVHSGAT